MNRREEKNLASCHRNPYSNELRRLFIILLPKLDSPDWFFSATKWHHTNMELKLSESSSNLINWLWLFYIDICRCFSLYHELRWCENAFCLNAILNNLWNGIEIKCGIQQNILENKSHYYIVANINQLKGIRVQSGQLHIIEKSSH